MWRMLQQPAGGDFVVSTGQTHSIRDLLATAFAVVGIEDWENYVEQDERFFRPAEVDLLVGDSARARDILGWKPTVEFPQLVEMMVESDLRALTAER
jgi:GDPmannose 4,6-dehydratase